MIENMSETVLDGNAVGALLQDIFVPEITNAQIECGTCGQTEALGSLHLYAIEMGAILRCIHCDNILMRAVHTPYGHWLEMKGARYLSL